jgi:glycosyltransferase involved in cell wall biosynthesis
MAKKILVISPIPTHPTNTGNRSAIYQISKGLKEMGHDVHFLYVNTEDCDERMMATCWGDGFHFVPYSFPRRSLRRYAERLKFVPQKWFRDLKTVDFYYNESLDKHLLELSRKIKFDVVMVEYVFWSRALECFGPDTLKVIDTHDVFTNRHVMHRKRGQPYKWYSTTAEEEKNGLNRADLILAKTEQDRQFFSTLTKKRIARVGHMVPLRPPCEVLPTDNMILFVGSDAEFNRDGITYFMQEMLPRIRHTVPEASLHLVGKVCHVVGDTDGCVKLGVVEDLAPVYAKSSLVISPIRYGTGQSIKTVEALGYAKPVVTTSVGARGLEAGAGKAFLIADGPAGFSESVIKVLADDQLSDSLSKSAYEFAKRWNEASLRELAAVLN